MTHILAPDDPVKENKRLLGHARHCRDLAKSSANVRKIQELTAIAKSYEAEAALILGLSKRQPPANGVQAFLQRIQRLASR
jgi:hypothetical protein